MGLFPAAAGSVDNEFVTDAHQKSADADNHWKKLAPGSAIIQQPEFLQSTWVKQEDD